MYVTLPVPLKYAGMLLGFGSFVAHMNTTIVLPKREEYFIQQVCIPMSVHSILRIQNISVPELTVQV